MTCPTCNGRGYVHRFAGDKHGDTCPDCHGGIPEKVLAGPAARRRNEAKPKPTPKPRRDHDWSAKPEGTPKVFEEVVLARPVRHDGCMVDGCTRPCIYGQRTCRGHHASGVRQRRDLTEAEAKEARSMAVFLSDAQIARKLRVTAADVRKALGR